MSAKEQFTKEDIDQLLKELGKEFRKRGKGVHTEIILIGGASVLIHYGFREMTTDIDALYTPSGVLKDAIRGVGDRQNLPEGWLNADFKQPASYSPHLAQYSKYYRTYANVLEVRTIQAEYLMAMKLVSGRRYKRDLSDIIGIVDAQQKMGNPLTWEQIDTAMVQLYGDWSRVNDMAIAVLKAALVSDDLLSMYEEQVYDETRARETVREIEKKYQDFVTKDNVNDVIAAALAKK